MDRSSTAQGSELVRLRSRGRITIPKRFRVALGIDDDTMLHFSLEEDCLRVAPASEDEINAWIDELIEEVRSER